MGEGHKWKDNQTKYHRKRVEYEEMFKEDIFFFHIFNIPQYEGRVSTISGDAYLIMVQNTSLRSHKRV